MFHFPFIYRLINSQLTKHKHKIHVCNTCLIHFYSETALIKHKDECNKIVTRLPSVDNNIVSFKNFKKQMDVPFVVYADFECILETINIQNSANVNSIQKHIPFAYSYYIKCSFNSSLDKFNIYSGDDAPKHFFVNLVKDCKDLYVNYLSIVKPMNTLTPSQQIRQKEDTICHICKKKIISCRSSSRSLSLNR